MCELGLESRILFDLLKVAVNLLLISQKGGAAPVPTSLPLWGLF